MKPAAIKAVAAACRCKPERLSPQLLRQAPELAALATLEAALAASACALLAAHPELDEEDFAATPQLPSAQACLADALLTQVHSVRLTLNRYRTLVILQEFWAGMQPHQAPAES